MRGSSAEAEKIPDLHLSRITPFSQCPNLTSKLLLPVAGDLAALGLDGLLAVSSCACSFPGAKSTVSFVGHAHTPLPLPAVRLAFLFCCWTKCTQTKHDFVTPR